MIIEFDNFKKKAKEIQEKAKKLREEIDLQYHLSNIYENDGLDSCADDAFEVADTYSSELGQMSGMLLISDFLDGMNKRNIKTQVYNVSKIYVSKDIYEEIKSLDIKILKITGSSKKEAEQATEWRILFSGFEVKEDLSINQIFLEDDFLVLKEEFR